jgi:hypothetical protein
LDQIDGQKGKDKEKNKIIEGDMPEEKSSDNLLSRARFSFAATHETGEPPLEDNDFVEDRVSSDQKDYLESILRTLSVLKKERFETRSKDIS